MGAKSKHYGDISKWIEKVIYSCENTDQIWVCEKLISNFRSNLETQFGLKVAYSTVEPLRTMFRHQLRNLTINDREIS